MQAVQNKREVPVRGCRRQGGVPFLSYTGMRRLLFTCVQRLYKGGQCRSEADIANELWVHGPR